MLQLAVDVVEDLSASPELKFKLHGKNVVLSDGGRSAERTASYNNGVVISHKPVRPGQLFRVCELLSRTLLLVLSAN